MGNKNQGFDIPVAIFLFKRLDSVLRIVSVLRQIEPKKVFLIGDGPRSDEEVQAVLNARSSIEDAIDWSCEVETNYADRNRGVFENIAGGAKWVFSKTDKAIFLEDDNLPQKTFFEFCKEMLERYEMDESIFWVCGTNYLERYRPADGASYVFSRHLLPCGWASWANKFNRYYDSNFKLLKSGESKKRAKRTYSCNALYRQQIRSARSEVYRKQKTGKYASWDFQLPLSIRANGLVGIVPCSNQIENIGVDEFSIHGGTSLSKEMTRRFCSIKSSPLSFPLVHPSSVVVDEEFEKKLDKVILAPIGLRMKIYVAKLIKGLFGISEFESFSKENSKWLH